MALRERDLHLCLAAPVTTILLIVLVSDGNRLLLQFIHDLHLFHERRTRSARHCPRIFWRSSACSLLGVGLGRVISINQFSLHGMYREPARADVSRGLAAQGGPPPERVHGFRRGDDMPFERAPRRRATLCTSSTPR